MSGVIYKRVILYQYFYLILSISFLSVSIWLWLSLSESKGRMDALLLSMAILSTALFVLFFVLSILHFIKKKDAITVINNEVLLKTYKEEKIIFSDIKDIKYRNDIRGGNAKYAPNVISYRSGTIYFTLNSGRKIAAKEIKEVRKACLELRHAILETAYDSKYLL